MLFNGNFLLRYDAYYIVSDWLEIPNLAPRSKQYLYYLVKRYIYGVRRPNNPAHVLGERIWFVFYGIASTMYRVIICVSIILMISQRFFFIGAVLAVGVLFLWVVMPLGKFVHYLATSTELMRVRSRAVGITLAFFLGIFAAVGFIDAPDRMRIEGVIEPVAVEIIHAKADGFITDFLPSDTPVVAGGDPLIVCQNRELAASLSDAHSPERVRRSCQGFVSKSSRHTVIRCSVRDTSPRSGAVSSSQAAASARARGTSRQKARGAIFIGSP